MTTAEPNHKMDALTAFMARFEAKQKEQAAFVVAWRGRNAKVQKRRCPRHSTLSDVDEEKSIKASWEAQTDILVFQACPACDREALEKSEAIMLHTLGVPENLLHCTLDNWTPRNEDDVKTLEKVREYSQKFIGLSLFFGRDKGVGKTHLSVALLRIMKRGMFISHSKFAKKLHEGYDNKYVNIVRDCSRTPFLVFDDFGTGLNWKDEKPAIFNVLENRIGDKKPFVITTNIRDKNLLERAFCSEQELDDARSDPEGTPPVSRIFDRMNECLAVCRMLKGESMRRKNEVRQRYLLQS